MYIYPLKFKTGPYPADSDLTVLDAKKNDVFFRPKLTDAIKEGKTPCKIFLNKSDSKPLITTLHQKKGEVESDLIKSADGTLLGTLVAESEHNWKVMDEQNHLVATIQEKSHWKNSCLFEIITFPFSQSDRDTYLKLLSPHRYEVTMNGKKVLNLREEVTVIRDDYYLKKGGDFSEKEETLLVVTLMLTLSNKF